MCCQESRRSVTGEVVGSVVGLASYVGGPDVAVKECLQQSKGSQQVVCFGVLGMQMVDLSHH